MIIIDDSIKYKGTNRMTATSMKVLIQFSLSTKVLIERQQQVWKY